MTVRPIAKPHEAPRIDLDEVQWLLDAGESPWQVALQLGCRPTGIRHAARRAGRTHLVTIYDRVIRTDRRAAA